MQINRINNVFTLALMLAALAGCANPTPRLDSKFGDTVNAAKAQQTLHPEASQNTETVVGMDGKAARSTIERYHKSFEQPPATGNVFTIGVGTGGSGSSGSGAGGGAR